MYHKSIDDFFPDWKWDHRKDYSSKIKTFNIPPRESPWPDPNCAHMYVVKERRIKYPENINFFQKLYTMINPKYISKGSEVARHLVCKHCGFEKAGIEKDWPKWSNVEYE